MSPICLTHTFCKAQIICYNKMQKLFILPHTSVVCIWNQKLMNSLEYWFIFAFNLAFIFWLAYISQKYILADIDILIPTSELIIYHSAALISIYIAMICRFFNLDEYCEQAFKSENTWTLDRGHKGHRPKAHIKAIHVCGIFVEHLGLHSCSNFAFSRRIQIIFRYMFNPQFGSHVARLIDVPVECNIIHTANMEPLENKWNLFDGSAKKKREREGKRK